MLSGKEELVGGGSEYGSGYLQDIFNLDIISSDDDSLEAIVSGLSATPNAIVKVASMLGKLVQEVQNEIKPDVDVMLSGKEELVGGGSEYGSDEGGEEGGIDEDSAEDSEVPELPDAGQDEGENPDDGDVDSDISDETENDEDMPDLPKEDEGEDNSEGEDNEEVKSDESSVEDTATTDSNDETDSSEPPELPEDKK
jgi:hypothetical protein